MTKPMADTPERVVLTERRGAALWIFINREDRRNALNPDVFAGIEAAIRSVADMPDLRAVVLTGVGEKAFCAGGDLSRGTGVFTEGNDSTTSQSGRLFRLMRELRVPLIARINGACVAGGFALMGSCDLAVAADHARFGLPEAKVGVFPMQVMVTLRRLIAPRHVNELCLTGEQIDASRAKEWGLVNVVVPYAELDAHVNAFVERIAACSPMAIERGRFAINQMESMSFHEAITYSEAQIALASMTADAREGLASFNERRPPAWVKTAGATK